MFQAFLKTVCFITTLSAEATAICKHPFRVQATSEISRNMADGSWQGRKEARANI